MNFPSHNWEKQDGFRFGSAGRKAPHSLFSDDLTNHAAVDIGQPCVAKAHAVQNRGAQVGHVHSVFDRFKAKLSAPHHERAFQESPPRMIRQQGSNRLVCLALMLAAVPFNTLMSIPSLFKLPTIGIECTTHASFVKPSSNEAVANKLCCWLLVDSVGRACGC